jgi:hypothetical protein
MKQFYFFAGRGGVFITVTNTCDINFSKGLVDKFHLGEYKAIRLSYDDADKMMVLEFLNEKVPGTAPIHLKPTFGIAAKRFLQLLKAKPGRYEVDWDEEKKTLVCIYDVAVADAA